MATGPLLASVLTVVLTIVLATTVIVAALCCSAATTPKRRRRPPAPPLRGPPGVAGAAGSQGPQGSQGPPAPGASPPLQPPMPAGTLLFSGSPSSSSNFADTTAGATPFAAFQIGSGTMVFGGGSDPTEFAWDPTVGVCSLQYVGAANKTVLIGVQTSAEFIDPPTSNDQPQWIKWTLEQNALVVGSDKTTLEPADGSTTYTNFLQPVILAPNDGITLAAANVTPLATLQACTVRTDSMTMSVYSL